MQSTTTVCTPSTARPGRDAPQAESRANVWLKPEATPGSLMPLGFRGRDVGPIMETADN